MIPDEENNKHCLAFREFFTQVADHGVRKFGGSQEEFGDVLNQCGGGSLANFAKTRLKTCKKEICPYAFTFSRRVSFSRSRMD